MRVQPVTTLAVTATPRSTRVFRVITAMGDLRRSTKKRQLGPAPRRANLSSRDTVKASTLPRQMGPGRTGNPGAHIIQRFPGVIRLFAADLANPGEKTESPGAV